MSAQFTRILPCAVACHAGTSGGHRRVSGPHAALVAVVAGCAAVTLKSSVGRLQPAHPADPSARGCETQQAALRGARA